MGSPQVVTPKLLIYNGSVINTSMPSSAMKAAIDCYIDVYFNKKIIVQLVWPGRPYNSLLIHALATLRLLGLPEEKKFRGLFFPSKITSCSPLIKYYLDASSLVQCVKQAARSDNHSEWDDWEIFHLRLQDLFEKMDITKSKIGCHHPHLNDIIIQFHPIQNSKEIWPNVCDHLFRGLKREMNLRSYQPLFHKIGEPAMTRYAVFHLPHTSKLAEIKKLIASPALCKDPPQIMLIDATRQSIKSCSFNFRSFLPKVIRTVCDTFGVNSPGFYVLTDNPVMASDLQYDFDKYFSNWKNSEGIEKHFNVQKATINWYYEDNGFDHLDAFLPLKKEHDPKVRVLGLALGKLHQQIHKLCNKLREQSLTEALQQLIRTNQFLRRVTTLPCGVSEFKKWLLEEKFTDEVMESYSRNFDWKSHALSIRHTILETSAAVISPDIKRLMGEIEKLYSGFENETPMARALNDEVRWTLANTHGRLIIVFPSRFQAMLAERFRKSQRLGVDQDVDRIGYHYGKIPEEMFNDQMVESLIVACNPENHLEILLSRDFKGKAGTTLIFDIEGAKKAYRLIEAILQDKQLIDYHSRAKAINGTLDKQIPHHLLKFPLIPDLDRAFKLLEIRSGESNIDSVPKSADQVVLYFNDRNHILCGRDSRFRVYDPESWNIPRFAIKTAKNLSEGDLVFLMPDDMRSDIEALLRTGGEQSLQHKLLEKYHQEVVHRASYLSQKKAVAARSIFVDMCRIDPELVTCENEENVRRWINVESLNDIPIEERKPQAPRRYRHFRAFAKAIGIEDNMAETYWNFSICQIRKDRIEEGRDAGEFFTNLVFDAAYVSIITQVSKSQIEELRLRALDNLHQVQRVWL